MPSLMYWIEYLLKQGLYTFRLSIEEWYVEVTIYCVGWVWGFVILQLGWIFNFACVIAMIGKVLEFRCFTR